MKINKFRIWDNAEQKMYYDAIQLGIDKVIYMQYTGLKDSQGCEIYEGDILSYYDEDMGSLVEGIVSFTNGKFVMLSYYGVTYYPHEIENSELLGNIFEIKDPLKIIKFIQATGFDLKLPL